MADTPENAPIPASDELEGKDASTTDPQDKSPAWEGEFDPERAARLVFNLRDESKKAREKLAELEKKLAEKEDAEKSEFQRLQERAERAEAELAKTNSALLVAEVSKAYGVPADLLTGSNREEIEARAKALAEWAQAPKRPADELPAKPKPRLIPGTGGDSGADDFDPTALAAKIRAHN